MVDAYSDMVTGRIKGRGEGMTEEKNDRVYKRLACKTEEFRIRIVKF